ncbi:uncharacterized protein METZ01_LOCUS59235, partial [marine metagenome]
VFEEICRNAEVEYLIIKLQKLGVSLLKVDFDSGIPGIESAPRYRLLTQVLAGHLGSKNA